MKSTAFKVFSCIVVAIGRKRKLFYFLKVGKVNLTMLVICIPEVIPPNFQFNNKSM